MRIVVSKAKGGLFRVRLDDRRGATGKVVTLDNVAKEDVPGKVRPELDKWETQRLAIKEARRK